MARMVPGGAATAASATPGRDARLRRCRVPAIREVAVRPLRERSGLSHGASPLHSRLVSIPQDRLNLCSDVRLPRVRPSWPFEQAVGRGSQSKDDFVSPRLVRRRTTVRSTPPDGAVDGSLRRSDGLALGSGRSAVGGRATSMASNDGVARNRSRGTAPRRYDLGRALAGARVRLSGQGTHDGAIGRIRAGRHLDRVLGTGHARCRRLTAASRHR